MTSFDPQAIFDRLHAAGVRYVIIGGWAVNAHGHQRYTGDVDICPDPDPSNLTRLAELLRALDARQLGMSEFEPEELPEDPADPRSLGRGGNFRLETALGIIDIMQWVSGDGRELEFADLMDGAISASVFGTPVTVCSLERLLEMKRAAGRPRDLEDLAALE